MVSRRSDCQRNGEPCPSGTTPNARDIRNYVTSSSRSSGYVAVAAVVVLALLCCSLPPTEGASYLDPDYTYTQVERRSEDNPELLQKVMLISRLLRGRQMGIASGLFMPVQRSLAGDPDAMRTRKRGPTSCINNCLTGGMSFVRCKSMCHW